MTLAHPPQLADPVITSLVGVTSLSRGRTYARKGAVSSVEWNPKKLELRGKVQGNRSAPYRTKVSFKDGISGLRLEWGDCSCPMQFNCKHVAALLLEITSGPVMEQPPLLVVPPPPNVQPAPAGQKAPQQNAAVQKSTQKPAPKKAPPAPWQEKIHSLLHPEAASRYAGFAGGPGRPNRPTLKLGVQLELTESASGQSAWYQRGRSDPWHNEAAPLLSLTARPVKQSSKGKWVMGQLRWDTFRQSYYGYQLDEFSSDQIRWMRTFAAVYAAEDTQLPSTHLPLERFDNPLLWQLLAQASEIGVALVAAKSGGAVVVHEPVSISLDVRAHGGGLRLAPHVSGGSSADPTAMGVIGRSGHGLFWWDAGTGPGTSSAAGDLHLAPSRAPVPSDPPGCCGQRTPAAPGTRLPRTRCSQWLAPRSAPATAPSCGCPAPGTSTTAAPGRRQQPA